MLASKLSAASVRSVRSSRPVGAAFVQAKVETRKSRVQAKHAKIRRKMSGTTERPRLAVYRSNEHIYAQVIDDSLMNTLVAANTMQKDVKVLIDNNGGTKEAAAVVGKKIAELCAAKNITMVCFDRGGFAYHGRVQAVAEAAREAGLIL
jgi:large subunit ribosomal protein L18